MFLEVSNQVAMVTLQTWQLKVPIAGNFCETGQIWVLYPHIQTHKHAHTHTQGSRLNVPHRKRRGQQSVTRSLGLYDTSDVAIQERRRQQQRFREAQLIQVEIDSLVVVTVVEMQSKSITRGVHRTLTPRSQTLFLHLDNMIPV